MPSYLVETYLPRGDAAARAARDGRARGAAHELTLGGTGVTFVRSIHLPQDEICFFVFEAPSLADATRVAELGALEPVRVLEAILSGEEHR